MSAQALYRRWRPQSFDDVIGQQPISTTLRNALATDRLAHAYLFTGPRGTGKTSVARILAKAVNCVGPADVAKPCNQCHICTAVTEGRLLDLVEIDAASHTGVDDVRDLRDKVGFAPNEARYKVYIIDEVHMLSGAAFNALLKTLEEPPAHVLFILATTEPHKIPDTILSRCQRHDFRRVSIADVAAKLATICAAEGVEAEPAALEMVARAGTGSIRDAESLLDLIVAGGGAITLESARSAMGTAGDDAVSALAQAYVTLDLPAGLTVINQALDAGADPRQFQSQLLDYLRGLLLIQTGIDQKLLNVPDDLRRSMAEHAAGLSPQRLATALRAFNDATPSADHTHPGLPLELAFIEAVLAADRPQPAPSVAGEAEAAPAVATPAPAVAAPAPKPAAAQRTAPPTAARAAVRPTAQPSAVAGEPPVADGSLEALVKGWPRIVQAVEQRDRNLAALLKDARPEKADASEVTVGFFYEFHCRRAAEGTRTAVLRGALAETTGLDRSVRCVVVSATAAEQRSRPSNRADQAKADPLVKAAVDEMGARISSVRVPDDEVSDKDPSAT